MSMPAALTPTELRRALKPVDAWWTALVIDPLAIRVLPYCLRVRRLTPNVVTALAFVVGAVAVGCFGLGHLRTGAVLIELRFVLDCMDGKIARLRGIASPMGAAMDRLADALTTPAAFAAVAWSLAANDVPDARLALLPAAASCLLVVSGLCLDQVRSHDLARAVPPSYGPNRVVAFARKHRLVLTPSTVEAEVAGLFVGPLLLHGSGLVTVELCVVGLYALLLLRDIAMLVLESRSGELA